MTHRKGKYQSMDNTEVGIKVSNTEKMKRSLKTYKRGHRKLRPFDTQGGLCQ